MRKYKNEKCGGPTATSKGNKMKEKNKTRGQNTDGQMSNAA